MDEFNKPIDNEPVNNASEDGSDSDNYDPFQPVEPVNNNPQPATPPPAMPERGMKWYKFLIYFAILAGVVFNGIQGIMYMNGSMYEFLGGDTDLVYATFPALHSVDIFFGVMLLIVAAYGIFVWLWMFKFKRHAPICLYVLYGAAILFTLIYVFAAASAMDVGIGELLDLSTILQLLVQAVLLGLNIVYFNKRNDMFNK